MVVIEKWWVSNPKKNMVVSSPRVPCQNSWLIHGGDPNYLLNGMILQVGIFFIPKHLTVQVLHAVFVCWHCLGCCYKPPWPPSNDPIHDPWPPSELVKSFFCWRVNLQSKPLQGTNMSPTVWKRKYINGWHIFPKVVYGRIQAATLFSEKIYVNFWKRALRCYFCIYLLVPRMGKDVYCTELFSKF